MDIVFLTKSGGILKPIATLLGWILNAIYEFLALFSQNHIANIALCIILFTIIVKMLMLPLTIKQQKSAKLSTKMNPELTAINEKYKGKTDQASRMKMQAETQAVYDKYGTNPMVGCLTLLISLPIMFALYRVIYAIPAYIGDIYEMYEKAAVAIQGVDGYVGSLTQFITDAGLKTIKISGFAEAAGGTLTTNHIIDILAKCNEGAWETLASSFPTISSYLTECSKPVIEVHGFLGGMNILNNPVQNGNYLSIGVIIPILAVAFNILQTRMQTMKPDSKPKGNNADPTAASMKTMNIVMPIMSGVICFMIPIGVGIYWIISSVVQIAQQFFINRYMDKISLDDMIAKGQAKQAKRREKMGIATGNKMAEVAKTSTKSIETEATVKSTADYAKIASKNTAADDKSSDTDQTESKLNDDKNQGGKTDSSAAGGSISGYANILKNRTGK